MTPIEKIAEFVKGDADALTFLLDVFNIVEVWDDLIDKDNPLQPSDISGAFYTALINLPRNPFYQRNFTLLNPVFEAAIMDWHTANSLESKGGDSLHMAFALRCGVQMLVVMCARIVGGIEWAKKVGVELREMGDTYAEYSAQFGVK